MFDCLASRPESVVKASGLPPSPKTMVFPTDKDATMGGKKVALAIVKPDLSLNLVHCEAHLKPAASVKEMSFEVAEQSAEKGIKKVFKVRNATSMMRYVALDIHTSKVGSLTHVSYSHISPPTTGPLPEEGGAARHEQAEHGGVVPAYRPARRHGPHGGPPRRQVMGPGPRRGRRYGWKEPGVGVWASWRLDWVFFFIILPHRGSTIYQSPTARMITGFLARCRMHAWPLRS